MQREFNVAAFRVESIAREWDDSRRWQGELKTHQRRAGQRQGCCQIFLRPRIPGIELASGRSDISRISKLVVARAEAQEIFGL
jgi:hypothetical protein